MMQRTSRLSQLLMTGAFTALVLLVLGLSMSVTQAQSDTTSTVRFVHVVPGVQAIDVYINDSLSVAGLDFGEATTYITVPAGTINLRVTLAGLTTELWQQPLAVPPGDSYTLIASSTDPLNFASFRDDPTTLSVGTARIMVVHAISGGPAIDFKVNGDLVVSDLAYGGFINSIDVPANTYQMSFLPTGDSAATPVLPETSVPLTSLTTQMLVLYGTASSAQTLILTTPTRPSGDAGFVRIAHGIADAPAVNVLVDGTLLVPSLEYGHVTDHLAIPAGSYNVSIQDAESGDDLATASLTVEAGKAQTVVALAGLGGASVGVFVDAIEGIEARQALVSVINTVPDAAASVTLADGTVLAQDLATGAASEAVSVAPADSVINVELGTADGAVTQASPSIALYGGVYYNVLILKDGALAVDATSLAQTVDSAPGASEAVVVAATTEPTIAPTEVVQAQATPAAATPEPVVVQPTVALVTALPTARILLDPGVNLQLREYPSAEAKSLGLAPSGTVLDVNGREGAPVDIDGNVIPLADGTDFVDPATLLTDEKADLEADLTWLNITYHTPDGGQITAWVNGLYLDVNDPKGLAQRLADLPTVPRNQPGEAEGTSISSPVAREEFVEAVVSQLDEGVNLNIRRTAKTDSEVLARVASGLSLELIGFGASGDWAFVRYRPVEGGAVTGWASTLYLTYQFRGATIDQEEMNARGLLEEVDEETLIGEISKDAPPLTQPTANPLKDVVVATVAELNEGIRLNLRRTPDVGGEVLTNIPAGTQLVVTSRSLNSEWLETEFDGFTGWVSVQYVTLSFNGLSTTIEDVPFNEEQVAAATGTPTVTPTPTS